MGSWVQVFSRLYLLLGLCFSPDLTRIIGPELQYFVMICTDRFASTVLTSFQEQGKNEGFLRIRGRFKRWRGRGKEWGEGKVECHYYQFPWSRASFAEGDKFPPRQQPLKTYLGKDHFFNLKREDYWWSIPNIHRLLCTFKLKQMDGNDPSFIFMCFIFIIYSV